MSPFYRTVGLIAAICLLLILALEVVLDQRALPTVWQRVENNADPLSVNTPHGRILLDYSSNRDGPYARVTVEALDDREAIRSSSPSRVSRPIPVHIGEEWAQNPRDPFAWPDGIHTFAVSSDDFGMDPVVMEPVTVDGKPAVFLHQRYTSHGSVYTVPPGTYLLAYSEKNSRWELARYRGWNAYSWVRRNIRQTQGALICVLLILGNLALVRLDGEELPRYHDRPTSWRQLTMSIGAVTIVIAPVLALLGWFLGMDCLLLLVILVLVLVPGLMRLMPRS